MIIDIDAGNSNIKWRVFNHGSSHYGGERIKPGKFATELLQFLAAHQVATESVKKIRIASVLSDITNKIMCDALLNAIGIQPSILKSTVRSSGVTNNYQNPQALGVDRWCAILTAVNELRTANKPLWSCVIDAGSAMTIDFINNNGVHQGGYITPGFAMQLRALFSDTEQVKVDAVSGFNELMPASNTADAVRRGVLLSMLSLIASSIKSFNSLHGCKAQIFITGGSAPQLLKLANFPMLYREHLVVDGIDLI